MIINRLKSEAFISDAEFDCIFPKNIQSLSGRHWTSVHIAKRATEFLCHSSGLKILDIGSGVGKFCLVGASLMPECNFEGVDLRSNFVTLSNQLKNTYKLQNANFICKDIVEMNFLGYDGFYFFNSFQEKIDDTASIDEYSELSYGLYKAYTQHIFTELNNMPTGTRIVTYHTADFFIPHTFELVQECMDSMLRFYIKSDEVDLDLYIGEQSISKHIEVYGS